MADQPAPAPGATTPIPTDPGRTEKLFERLVELLDRNKGALESELDARLNRLAAEQDTRLTSLLEERLKGAGSEARKLVETAQSQAINAALHAAATAAGAHDVPTVALLLDRSGITVDAEGAVTGLDAAFAKLKAEKKFLFGAAQPTGGTARTPRPGDGAPKSARDLTDAEWAAEKRRLGLR